MQLGKFVLSPFVDNMFAQSKTGAIFVFQHVESNLHFAARYADASRYSGSQSYPLALTNKLLKQPSEVRVFVLPLRTTNKSTALVIMNKVVDALIENGLFRKCQRIVDGAMNVIHEERFTIFQIKHKNTKAVYYTYDLAHQSPQIVLNRFIFRLNELALDTLKKIDVLIAFAKQFYPHGENSWEITPVTVAERLTATYQKLEQLSLEKIEQGQLLLSRIRTQCPTSHYNQIYRHQNLDVIDYLIKGLGGSLMKKS